MVNCAPREVHRAERDAVEHGLLPAMAVPNRTQAAWRIEERMARYHVAGVSIAVINGGKIDWAKGYGRTASEGTRPVTETTLFQAASLVKLVTATGALRLVQAGVLDLDRDVNAQLLTWRVPMNRYTAERPVTLRQLLSHRAGVTSHGFAGYANGEPLPTLRQILEGEPPANSQPVRVDLLPGSQFRYSGGGYEIIQQLVEDATGRSFADVIQRRVFDPARMTNTTFQLPLSVERRAMVACGHTYGGEPVDHCWKQYPETAAAGLWTSPLNLAKLGIALSNAVNGIANPILRQAIVVQMLTKDADDMGLGPGVHGDGDSLSFDHAGWNAGYRSYMVMYPKLGKGVAIMANGDGGDLVIQEIVRSVARTYQWPDYAPQQRRVAVIDTLMLNALVGEYDVREYGLVLSVTRDGDHLILSTTRGSWYTYYPSTNNRFFAIEDGSEISFAIAAESIPSTLYIWGMSALRRTVPVQ